MVSATRDLSSENTDKLNKFEQFVCLDRFLSLITVLINLINLI